LHNTCDGIIRNRQGTIDAPYSCHICLIRYYGKHPDELVTYSYWSEDEEHIIENTLEVYLIDKELIS